MTTYHFIGIKGTGMSALAQILHDSGEKVKGSDVEKRFFTQRALEEKNIPIEPFSENNITDDCTIIAGNAFSESNVEIKTAKEKNIPFYWYHDFLGEWLKQYTSIAVTGAHGKTSTTGLLAHVFSHAYPISYLIGDGTGEGHIDSKYFVFEACEYRRHFLRYEPDYAIITNIDFDHPDYFSSIDDVFDAFQSMADNVQKGIIACGDDDLLQQIETKVPIMYYGFRDTNDFQAKNIKETNEGTFFDVYVRNTFFDTMMIPMFGNHNVLNALSVIAISHYEGMEKSKMKQLRSFQGVKRRFTEKKLSGQILIDDYAHHPIEISATIESARKKYPDKNLVAIFQPHTYSRTKAFIQEFADSLNEADHVYLCDIFGSARENGGHLSINDLQELIPDSHLLNINNVGELKTYANDVLVFMGAGDIQKFQEAYEKEAISEPIDK